MNRGQTAEHPRARLPVVLLLGFTAAVTVVDLVTGRHFRITTLLLLVPVAAAALLPPLTTGLLSTAAVACLIAIYGVWDVGGMQVSDWLSIGAVALTAAGCTAASGVRERHLRQLIRARYTLAVLQRALLRDLPLRAGDIEVHGFYRSADAAARVGGDLYEAVETPYGVRVLIGDVQGSGVAAVGTGAAVLAAFREGAQYQPDLRVLAGRLDRAVTRHHRLMNSGESAGPAEGDAGEETERFATALIVQFAPDGAVDLVDCGHLAPFVLRNGRVREIRATDPGLPLGLMGLGAAARRTALPADGEAWSWADGPPVRAEPAPLTAGSVLLLCTDGVVETRNRSGRFYPLAERLTRWADRAPRDLVRLLERDLVAFARGELGDDAAVIALRVPGPSAGGAAQAGGPDPAPEP